VSTVCVFEFVRSDSFPTALFRQNICETQRRWKSHRSRCPTRSRDQTVPIKRLDKCSLTFLHRNLVQDTSKSLSFIK